MITRKKPEKNRLRRTMMFMNAQKPGLIKDAYIYGSDSIILDQSVINRRQSDSCNVYTGDEGIRERAEEDLPAAVRNFFCSSACSSCLWTSWWI